MNFDVCVIGSGAGGGPIAAKLSEAGHRVVVLEKGGWYDESQFLKDEIAIVRRPNFFPRQSEEPQVVDSFDARQAGSGANVSNKFWNGSLVGGSSVLMSGFFMRFKRDDFRYRSTYGPRPEANVADWPISYEEFSSWYDVAEHEVGISGRSVPASRHLSDLRGSPDFPMPPTREHPFAAKLDAACKRIGLNPIPLPRAVLSQDYAGRKACDYNGYCGSYGCTTGAKGSSLAAFMNRAHATGRCEIRSRCMVYHLETDPRTGAITKAKYFDRTGARQEVTARIFVVACQAIESARLLLNSKGARHRNGLANSSGQVGQNLLFSTFGAGWGDFPKKAGRDPLASTEPFVNRIIQDWYFYDPKDPTRNAGRDDVQPGPHMVKSGTLNFLLMHPNPIIGAIVQASADQRPIREVQAPNGRIRMRIPLWGEPLKQRLAHYFTQVHHLRFEVFSDWLPHAGSQISLHPKVRDKWGLPVSWVRALNRPSCRDASSFLVDQGQRILEAAGAQNVRVSRGGGPSSNLIAGACRFGDDPKNSVLDRNCKAHDVDNLYVTDASFLPSGGAVPYTFTIYANALRVAEHLKSRL